MQTATRVSLGGISRQPIQEAPIIKYCLYARKSTEEEDKQALSIESQVKEMTALAEREGLNITEVKREAHSSKEVGQRAVYNQLLAEIRNGKFNGILTWAPDRLSRNAGDLGAVVDLLDKGKLVAIRTYTQKFTNNPNEKFMLMILGSQAKLENDNKIINVKRGLRARCEMGWRPSTPSTGYLSEKHVDKKCQVRLDPKRAVVIRQIFEKVGNEGWSGRQTYKWLCKMGFKTKNGKKLSLANLYIILRNTYYYGEFEYPVGSGNWYQGKHEPIITRELFDKVQANLQDQYIPKTESKEFAFTRLIKCGYCESGITADEKFKKLKDGGVNRHVYYMCTGAKDTDCKNRPINEELLIEELGGLLDTVDVDEIGMREKIEAEVARYNKFRVGVLGAKKKERGDEIDVRTYAKYLLKEGTVTEKRELLSCLKSQLVLKDRKVLLK
ncbi:MAG: recombinase family protein [Patescibacteria group bacterium]|nr:recombinase family protein [Patescibacteria group bacterium]